MPQDPLAIKPYYGGLVTLTSTKQSIQALLTQIYAGITNAIPPPNMSVKELHLKADSGNAGNNCLIGDENLTTGNYADQLTSTAADRALVYGPYENQVIPIANIFAIASGGSPKMLITVIP